MITGSVCTASCTIFIIYIQYNSLFFVKSIINGIYAFLKISGLSYCTAIIIINSHINALAA